MKTRNILASLVSAAYFAAANAAPSHQAEPSGYDNVGSGQVSGQTFVAEEGSLIGVSWYIGDPTRPQLASVNGLSGDASLILYEASNLLIPIEISRQSIIGAGDSTLGLTRFDFAAPVSIHTGTTYFISIESVDGFGIGLRSLTQSTYQGGSQGVYSPLGLILDISGRDTSFEIHSSPVPEPGSAGLLLTGFALIAFKLAAKQRKREA